MTDWPLSPLVKHTSKLPRAIQFSAVVTLSGFDEETFDTPSIQRRVSSGARAASQAFCGNEDCIVDPLSMSVMEN